jgi:hypothetical protein
MAFAPHWSVMAPRKTDRKRQGTSKPDHEAPEPGAAERPASEEELQGPPARETTIVRSDRERQEHERLADRHDTSPELAGGDIDADWERAASVGEEAPGGTVATPDQDIVDDLGDAWGVGRAPDEEVRTSQEILEGRDRYRWEEEE